MKVENAIKLIDNSANFKPKMEAFKFSFKSIEINMPFPIKEIPSNENVYIEKTGELEPKNAIEIL